MNVALLVYYFIQLMFIQLLFIRLVHVCVPLSSNLLLAFILIVVLLQFIFNCSVCVHPICVQRTDWHTPSWQILPSRDGSQAGGEGKSRKTHEGHNNILSLVYSAFYVVHELRFSSTIVQIRKSNRTYIRFTFCFQMRHEFPRY